MLYGLTPNCTCAEIVHKLSVVLIKVKSTAILTCSLELEIHCGLLITIQVNAGCAAASNKL